MSTTWPQDHGNAQRTSSGTITPSGPWTFRGAFNGPDSAPGSTSAHVFSAPPEGRPVVSGAGYFAPAGASGVYARDPTTLAALWQWALHLNVLGSPAVDEITGTLLVGATDHYLSKINISTGLSISSYLAAGAIRKAVLVVGAFVYVVTDAGTLHKVNISTMAVAWTYTATGSVIAQTPPAYSAATGKIVFATSDLFVHAVNDADGSLAWRVKPNTTLSAAATDSTGRHPYTFELGWPVIADQHQMVIVRVRPFDDQGSAYSSSPARTGATTAGTPGTPGTQAELKAWFAANPAAQSTYVLNLADGSVAFMPNLQYNTMEDWSITQAGPYNQLHQMPAVVVNADGTETAVGIFKTYVDCENTTLANRGSDDGRWQGHMGEMVFDATSVAGLSGGDCRFMRHARYSGSGNSGGYLANGYSYIQDETGPVVVLGAQVWHCHWMAKEGVAIADRSSTLGLTYTNPIATSDLPLILEGTNDANGADANAQTHFWATSNPSSAFMGGLGARGYYGVPNGGGAAGAFWSYWNVTPPPTVNTGGAQSTAYVAPRTVIVSGHMLYAVDSGGGVIALQHTGTVPTGSMLASASGNLPAQSGTVTATPTSQSFINSTTGFEDATFSFWTSVVVSGSGQPAVVQPSAAHAGTYGASFSRSSAVASGSGVYGSEPYGGLAAPATSDRACTTFNFARPLGTVVAQCSMKPLVIPTDASGCHVFELRDQVNPDLNRASFMLHGSTVLRARYIKNDGTIYSVDWGTALSPSTFYTLRLTVNPSTGTNVISWEVDAGSGLVLVAQLTDVTVGPVTLPNQARVGVWLETTGAHADPTYAGVGQVAIDDVSINRPAPANTAAPTGSLPAQTGTVLAGVGWSQAASGTATVSTPAVAGPVSVGGKYEAAFALGSSTYVEPFLPYAASPPTGVGAGTGVSVDAQLIPPDGNGNQGSSASWGSALVHACFWTIPYTFADHGSVGQNSWTWAYPTSAGTWMLRFQPNVAGIWTYRIRVIDGNGTSYSATQTFNAATPAVSHGVIVASASDHRYFQWTDGTPYVGFGVQQSPGQIVDPLLSPATLTARANAGLSVLRTWFSSTQVVGGEWPNWWNFNAPNYGGSGNLGSWPKPPNGGVLPTLSNGRSAQMVWRLSLANANPPALILGYTGGIVNLLPVTPNTTYKLSITARTIGYSGTDGLHLRFGGFPTGTSWPTQAGLSTIITPNVANDGAWHTVSGTWSSGGLYWMPYVYVILEGATAGTGEVAEIQCQELLSTGFYGPNLFGQGQSDLHRELSLRHAAYWDDAFDRAAAQGVALKCVAFDKDDDVWNVLNTDGTISATFNDTTNFNILDATGQAPWFMAAVARYFAARWGYSPGLHSWEWGNELSADPTALNASGLWAAAYHTADAHKHLASNSVSVTQPFVPEAWIQTNGLANDYADSHGYICTLFDTFGNEWFVPSGLALDATTANVYNGQGSALTTTTAQTATFAAAQAIDPTYTLQGDGSSSNWTFRMRTKASGANAAPVAVIKVDGVTKATLTGASGTSAYAQVSATFTIPDAAWHSATVSLISTGLSAGQLWWDDMAVIAPNGHRWRFAGDGHFDDHVDLWADTAEQLSAIGGLYGGRAPGGIGRPYIRGEDGLSQKGSVAGGNQTSHPDVILDTAGVWLHCLLFGGFARGGMYDIYWWTDTSGTQRALNANNLYSHYGRHQAIFGAIPLHNGNYQDLQYDGHSNANMRVLGQKDLTNNKAHLWVRHLGFTWQNVLHNTSAYGRLAGTVTVSGLANGTYSLHTWEFRSTTYNGAQSNGGGWWTESIGTITCSGGVISISLDALAATTTDAAFTIS